MSRESARHDPRAPLRGCFVVKVYAHTVKLVVKEIGLFQLHYKATAGCDCASWYAQLDVESFLAVACEAAAAHTQRYRAGRGCIQLADGRTFCSVVVKITGFHQQIERAIHRQTFVDRIAS